MRIVKKQKIAQDIFLFEIESSAISKKIKAGQFIILIPHEKGEGIPLTMNQVNTEKGTIRIIFQVVGKSTYHLSQLQEGQDVYALRGPLGKFTQIKKFGTVVCVGGGIGNAPIQPIARAMKEAGNKLSLIMGARSKDFLILEEDMKKIADELIVCTDDGSYGRKCLITQPLKELCEQSPGPDLVVAIGPLVMMKFCAETTRPYGISTVVSLNPIMVDGTGMCGGCRVSVGGRIRFACVDGPEFDGHEVDFDELIQRLQAYKEEETLSHEKYARKCAK